MGMSHVSLNIALRESVQDGYEGVVLMASGWIQKGYRTCSIWEDELIFCWPLSAWDEVARLRDMEGTLSGSIKRREQIVGKMVLTGGAKTSLDEDIFNAQVNIVTLILTMTVNFEEATSELVAQAQLKTEIDLATQMQQRLLPKHSPHVNGLDVYARSCAAQRVGGDFYDFFFAENRLIFVVGDISGRGFPAALFMLMVRIVLRTVANVHSTSDPRNILECANENLYNDFADAGLLATIFIGRYDPYERQLTYTNGAHSPVIYCPKSGRACFLAADVVPLGVFPTMASTNHTIAFEAGDLLVIGTDGLSKCFDLNGELFGNECLLTAVETFAHQPANQLGNALFETLTLFAEGVSQEDDQTLVVIKGVAL